MGKWFLVEPSKKGKEEKDGRDQVVEREEEASGDPLRVWE
jgi:hypothetical protein